MINIFYFIPRCISIYITKAFSVVLLYYCNLNFNLKLYMIKMKSNASGYKNTNFRSFYDVRKSLTQCIPNLNERTVQTITKNEIKNLICLKRFHYFSSFLIVHFEKLEQFEIKIESNLWGFSNLKAIFSLFSFLFVEFLSIFSKIA